MAIEVRTTWDVRALVKTLEGLSSPRLERAAAVALNDTAKNAQVQAVKLVAPQLGLPSGEMKRSIGLGSPATPAHLKTSVIGSGRPIPLIRFRARDTHGSGVVVRIAGHTETYRRAFIAKMKSGHVGVFERMTPGRRAIRQLYGPSAAGMFGRQDVLGVVTRTLDENLLKNLRRQVDRQLRAGRGLAGSRTLGGP
jgi:hypothetical protein